MACADCNLPRCSHETSIGYWHGKANGLTLSLNKRPSGHNFSSPTPSTHSMYASHCPETGYLPVFSGQDALFCGTTEILIFFFCYIIFFFLKVE